MDALVVGAGPTGLLMGVELARHGLECRVIDRDEHGATESRALAIQARTVEVFDDLGVADEALARGLKAAGVNMWSGSGERLAHITFDAMDGPYPFVLDLPQSETEALLERRLNALGVQVERRTELVGFEQDTDKVTATLGSPTGEETVRTHWLLGCDGAHSAVRHVLGIGFAGETVDVDWGLADVVVEWPLADREMHMFLSEEGLMAAFPMPEGRWRLICEMGPAGDGPAPSPDLDFFTETARRRSGESRVEVSDPRWLAAFRVNERQASEVREGRCFIAGDAAHVHSPAGGQGMNTGLQDAYNLAWKLALVHRGRAPDWILDTYELERRPVATRVVKLTSAMFKAALLRSEAAQRLRDAVIRHLAGLAPVQRRMLHTISERDINYRDSPLVAEHRRPLRAPHAGDLAPDAGPSLRAALHGTAHVLLVFDEQAQPGEIEAAYPGVLETHVFADRDAHEAYGGAALCLVRPDGYIGYISGDADEAALRGYLDRMLIPAASADQ
jgi:2-polyprenyl-6-methoxyphenol hydroxylase-like FAD-dependent oxidoreductase